MDEHGTEPRPASRRSLLATVVLAAVLGLTAGQAWPAVTLTDLEQAYVQDHPEVSLCVDPDWVPFESISEQGRHEGIAADLLRLVAERTGLRLRLVPTGSWDESLAASREGRCQLLSFLNQTPQREQWLLFSEPLFTDTNVFITREAHPFISDPGGLRDETIVLPRGTAMEEFIRRDYPNLRVITTDSENEAMILVSDKKADLTLRSLIVAAYTIRKEGLFNLKIAGQLPRYENRLRVGIAGKNVVLRDIINKGIASITNQERGGIVNRHVSIQVQAATDYALVFKLLGTAVLLGAAGVLWGYRTRKYNAILRAEIARRQELEKIREDIEQIVRHDLLSPLAGIVTIPELLLDDDNLTERQRELLGHVKYSGTRLLHNIRMASDLIKMEKGTYRAGRREFDGLHALRSIQRDLKTYFEAKQLRFDILRDGVAADASATCPLVADEHLFCNMLENLVKNACEASPDGQTVTVVLDTAASRLTVGNHGVVAPEIRDTFFDKYVTYGKRHGTGLGTYSAKMIARAMGGTMTLDTSVPGQTRIVIELPGCFPPPQGV
jgi:signal transduction histidine kinase